MVQKLATTLKLQLPLLKQEVPIVKTTNNVEAYDSVLRGLAHLLRYSTQKENLQARELFETALRLDPQFADACALVGFTYIAEWGMQWNRDPKILERTLEYEQRAIALNDFHAPGHMLLALGYVQKAHIDRALSEVERVIALQPNLAESYQVQAEVLMVAGRPVEALQSIQHAIRLNPRGPFLYFAILGWAYHLTDQYAESNAAYKRVLTLNPLFSPAYLMEAFNYLGQWTAQQSHDPKILDLAYDAVQNAIALNDALPAGHTALGAVYLLQKQYDDAITAFEQAVVIEENYVCGQMLLAEGLSLAGRVEEGMQIGERALSLKALPSDDRCLYGVANAFALAGRLEEAAALHQRLLK